MLSFSLNLTACYGRQAWRPYFKFCNFVLSFLIIPPFEKGGLGGI
ncbi:hypothetical protein HPSMNH_0792 [Glaesserella parasuis MN-H]|nr:hypothetical protein HPSMNH_0792 [Glaesserella parasuis MN-H]